MEKTAEPSIRDKHKKAIKAAFGPKGTHESALDLINAILTDADNVEAQRDEYETERDELQAELDEHASDMEAALLAVKYWMQDALVLHKPITDPRKILRMVEDAL